MAFSTNGGSGGKVPPTLSEINVTPLVDVMLVLLIIFMVTAAVETVRVEQELDQVRIERELVPPKPEEPKNPLKDVPVVVPNTNVKKINESEQKEPKVVLASDLTFRLDDTVVIDCKKEYAQLNSLPQTGRDPVANKFFGLCATRAANILGPNALLQEKKRVNFAADQGIPWAWATQFMAVMGMQHGIKQVNVVVTNQPKPPEPAK